MHCYGVLVIESFLPKSFAQNKHRSLGQCFNDPATKVALNEKYFRCFDCSRSNSHFGRDLGLFHEVEALPELRLDPSACSA